MTPTPASPHAAAVLPDLTPRQEEAVERIVGDTGNLVVVGAPGAGKTTVVVAAAARAVARGMDPSRLLLLAPTRQAAARLRDIAGLAVGTPVGTPLVRTPASLAYAIVRERAHREGEPAPMLVTGAEQDVMLREVLQGHAGGRVAPLDWGGAVPEGASLLPGFRAELRDLLNRAAEAGLVPEDLEDLARRVGRPEWAAAAAVMREYESIAALRSLPGDQGVRFDHATAIAHAAHEVDSSDGASLRDLIIVDDAHDVTAATHDLLGALAHRGARIVLVGNADEAVQGYRGAVPEALSMATRERGPFALGADVVELGAGLRQVPVLERVSAAVAQRIGTSGVGSPRGPLPPLDADAGGVQPVVALTAQHRYGQSRAIAAALRRARHGFDGQTPVPWSRMCVIARSAARLREVRSDLAAADIPCESLGDAVALHEQPAVAPLLRILRAVGGEPWTEADAVEFLGSRVVALDAVALRRLRRALVRHDREAGGQRLWGELVVEALDDPRRWSGVPGAEARRAATAATAIAAARERAAAPGATPGAVLWAAWDALDVAQSWRKAALDGSARDDADLDAVIALLRAAQTYAERLAFGGVREFVEYLEGQDFAADSLGVRGDSGDVVAFATAASAAGREWDVVVIAGLEEGTWPHLRLRDSVLGAQHLADIASGRAQATPLGARARTEHIALARRHVLDDETRAMLVAVSRARTQVIATAVVDDQSRPSRFLTLLADAAGVEVTPAASGWAQAGGRVPVSDLRSAVAALRVRGVEDPASVVPTLAWLARESVPGAHPRDWHGVAEPSTEAGFWQDDEKVRVSPSKVEWVEKCTLRWALETAGGTRESTDAQQIGTLIHELAATHPRGGLQAILADFDEAWSSQFPRETWADEVAYSRAREVAEKLAHYLAARTADSVLTEHRFAVEVGRAELAGSMDRVEVHGDGAVVVDLKTGTSAPSEAEAQEHAQLAMYQLAVALGAVPDVAQSHGAELAYVALNKAGATRAQAPVDVDQATARLGEVVARMTRHTFDAVINDKCDSCPVRRACPAQSQGRQVSDA